MGKGDADSLIKCWRWLPFLLFPINSLWAEPYPGLPTHDQNPMLQGYFIPAMPVTSEQGWSSSQSLYITNTYQQLDNRREYLEIDVENIRFDLQMSYSRELWRFNGNLSLISNRHGSLDQAIDGWHDLLGVPEAGRNLVERDRLRLYYQRDDDPAIVIDQASNGIGDLQLAAGYQWSQNRQIWAALELPMNAEQPISNQSTDAALWLTTQALGELVEQHWSSLGLVIPGQDGLFKEYLNRAYVFAQAGFSYSLLPGYLAVIQADYHSPMVSGSTLKALDHSLQAQFALRMDRLFKNVTLELFFSEDIYFFSAPDITFALRFSPS